MTISLRQSNARQEPSPVASPKSEWRKLAFDIALAILLAWVFAVLVDWWHAPAAPRPCDVAIHRLVVEPNPQPRCLTLRADWPA